MSSLRFHAPTRAYWRGERHRYEPLACTPPMSAAPYLASWTQEGPRPADAHSLLSPAEVPIFPRIEPCQNGANSKDTGGVY